jgi:NADPH:quinone reductase-like Zn-dependent oxidoreductase
MPPRCPARPRPRPLNVTNGETLLLFGGGGSVGIIATQLNATSNRR